MSHGVAPTLNEAKAELRGVADDDLSCETCCALFRDRAFLTSGR